MELIHLILLFFFYSFFGWIMEICLCIFMDKKFVNRGFLIGPLCPIYGCGAILVTLLLQRYDGELLTLFCMSVIICEALEYLTSYLMEKIFYARWWDYSNKKYNINGRICLETAIPFGLLCCFMIKVLNPTAIKIFEIINDKALVFISGIICSLFIIDLFLSISAVIKIRGKFKSSLKDSTEEITREVKEFIERENRILQKRIIKAFPNLSLLKEIKKRIKSKS